MNCLDSCNSYHCYDSYQAKLDHIKTTGDYY